jgi:uncharacterized protein
MIWLVPAFLITALLYASVGFGGGSTYTALLALAETDYRILPAISLLCNIIVVTGGVIRFGRAGLLDWKRALPLAMIAAPFAWAGGLTPIKESTFLLLLASSLLIAGGHLLIAKEPLASPPDTPVRKIDMRDILVVIGLGYLSGLVGIGGGIFLAPYLHFTRWGRSQQIAAAASLFILINSVSGLIGQSIKLGSAGGFGDLVAYWPLAIAVLVGGQIGSHLGVRILPASVIRRLTGILILYVSANLFWKIFAG